MSDTGWMQRGACREADPELFHSEQYQQMARGKEMCVTCPVRTECLEFALARWFYGPSETDPLDDAIGRFGVWGGTLPSERARMMLSRAA